MKKFALAVSLLVTFIVSQTAAADGRNGRHGFSDFRSGGNHFRSFDRRHNRGFSGRAVNSYHYGRAGSRRNDFVSISYGNRFNNRGFNNRFNGRFNRGFYNSGFGFDNRWGNRNRWSRNRGNGDFVGGLFLGSLLNQRTLLNHRTIPISSHETVIYRSAPVVSGQRVIATTARAPLSVPPKRRILRDLRGDCFEIEITPNGDELRSQIDRGFCEF